MLRILGTVVLFLSTVYLFSSDNEIVVTGNRIPQDASTSTEVLEILDSEELEKYDNIQDALTSVPGINVTGSGSGFVTMGGFGANGFARVLILVDGIALNRPDMKSIDLSKIDIQNIEKIEILRGAATARYGDQAVGGVINIITKKANGFDLSVESSSNEIFSNQQSMQFSYGVDDFNLSLYLKRDQIISFRENNNSNNLEGELKGGLSFDNFSFQLGSSLKQFDYQMPGSLGLDLFDTTPEVSYAEDYVEGFSWRSNLLFEYESNDFYLSLPVSFSKSYEETNYIYIPTSYYNTANLNTVDAQLIASLDFYLNDTNAVTATAGVDSQYGLLGVSTSPTIERTSFTYDNEITRISVAPWMQLQYSFNDLILVDAGGRYSNLNAEVKGNSLTGTYEHAPIVFDGSIAFLPADDLKLSVSVSQLYRYPLLDEQAQFYSPTPSVNLALKPESGLSINFAGDWTSDLLKTTLSGYYILMEDEIGYVSYNNINMDNTLHLGGAIDSTFTYKDISVSAGYGYDYAVFREGANDGKQIPLVPNHIVTAAASWNTEIGLSFNIDFRWTSDFYADGDFSNSLDKKGGRIDWDFIVDYTFIEKIKVAFKISNILDDKMSRYISNYGSYGGYPVEGRHFELLVKWSY